MQKIIQLGINGGQSIFYDDEDSSKVDDVTWYIEHHNQVLGSPNGVIMPITHYLIGYLGRLFIDHIDGNTLNNHKSNLREATASENSRNQGKRQFYGNRRTTSQYKGVCFDTVRGLWKAQIGLITSCPTYLGHYFSEIEAAMAYNQAAIEYFGEFKRLNVIPKALTSDLFVPMTFENLIRLLSSYQDERCIIAARRFVDSIERLDSVQLPDPSDVNEQLLASIAIRAISQAMRTNSPDWCNEIRIAQCNSRADKIYEMLRRM